jgi:hypothetical protein
VFQVVHRVQTCSRRHHFFTGTTSTEETPGAARLELARMGAAEADATVKVRATAANVILQSISVSSLCESCEVPQYHRVQY